MAGYELLFFYTTPRNLAHAVNFCSGNALFECRQGRRLPWHTVWLSSPFLHTNGWILLHTANERYNNIIAWQPPHIVQTHQCFRERLPLHPHGTTPRLETKSVCLNVTRLSAQQDFIEFFSHETFKTNERFLPHPCPFIHSLIFN